MGNLSLLFQLRMYHSYYDDGVMANMQLVPEGATQAWMSRYQLLLQEEIGRLTLYYSGEYAERLYTSLHNLIGLQPLEFIMISSNPNFGIISYLPVDWSGQLLFSSQATQKEEGQGGTMVMQLSSKKNAKSGAIGRVSFYLSDLFTTDGKWKQPNYRISMEARRTVWRYYVVNPNQIPLLHPQISNPQGIDFEAEGDVSLPTGEQALQFSSGHHKFPFQETPDVKLNLITHLARSNKTRVVRKGLPVPRGNQIEIQKGPPFQEKPKVFSDIYVYL